MEGGESKCRGSWARSWGLDPLKQELIQPFHADVFVTHDAFGIMALERKSALSEFPGEVCASLRARRFIVFKHAFAIDQHRNAVSLDNNLLCPPFIILRRRLSDIHQPVKAGGFDPIAMRIIDLALEAAFRPAFRLI